MLGSFDRDDIVIDRLAAADQIDLGIRALAGEGVARLVRVLFIHILAVEDGDELRFAGRCLVGEPVEQRGDVAVGAEQLAVQKCQIIALVDVEAVKIGIARGVGDLRGGDASSRSRPAGWRRLG